MKRLLSLVFAIGSTGIALAQSTVSGTVTDLSSTPIANHKLSVMTNRQGPGSFPPINVTTNTSGQYTATLPTGVANNTPIIVMTYDCNSTMVSNNHTYTGSNITSNFSICVGGNPPSGMSGLVYCNNNKRSVRAVVYRIKKCTGTPTTLSLIDSVLTDTLGAYSFSTSPSVGNCDLLMKAALLSSDANYSNYMPSYYVSQSSSALLWSGAATVPSTSGGVNIQLIAGTNPGGPGFIGGSVLQGANKGTGTGDPVANRMFILTDVGGNAVAYTFSDANGKFGFSDLPYGTYKVFGDAWAKDNPELTVTIDNNVSSVNSIMFFETSKKLEGFLYPASVTNSAMSANIAVYPNPASDVLNISGLNTYTGVKQITLYAATGALVYNTSVENTGVVTIPVKSLATGMYILKIQAEAEVKTYKILK